MSLATDQSEHTSNNQNRSLHPLQAGHIRLLTFAKRDVHWNNPRKQRWWFRHQTVDLDNAPEYLVLSLDSDAAVRSRNLSDDAEHNIEVYFNDSRVRLKSNLFAFLRVLITDIQEGDHVWNDVLCVNRRDPNEKVGRIRLMKRIILQASEVRIWTGNVHQNLPRSLHTVMGSWLQADADEGGSDRLWADLDEPSRWRIWLAFWHVCTNSYWDRLRVVQECVLNGSTYIQCMSSKLDVRLIFIILARLEKLAGSDTTVRQISYLDRKTPLNVYRISQLANKPTNERTIMLTSSLLAPLQCTDNRDKIYELLSLTTLADEKEFPVDYEIELAELCTRVAAFDIQKGHTLESLHSRLMAPVSELELPSWVPPLTEQVLSGDRDVLTLVNSQAGRPSLSQVSFSNNGSSLNILGRPVIRITHIHELNAWEMADYTQIQLQSGPLGGGFWPQFAAGISFLLKEAYLTFNGAAQVDEAMVLWLLEACCLAYSIILTTWWCFAEVEEDCIWLLAPVFKNYLQQEREGSAYIEWLRDHFYDVLDNFLFIVTGSRLPRTVSELESSGSNPAMSIVHAASGRPSFLFQGSFIHSDSWGKNGPGSWVKARAGKSINRVQREDVVAVIDGCRFPVVLRRADEVYTYHLVGAAHVEGLRDQEAVNVVPEIDMSIV